MEEIAHAPPSNKLQLDATYDQAPHTSVSKTTINLLLLLRTRSDDKWTKTHEIMHTQLD